MVMLIWLAIYYYFQVFVRRFQFFFQIKLGWVRSGLTLVPDIGIKWVTHSSLLGQTTFLSSKSLAVLLMPMKFNLNECHWVSRTSMIPRFLWFLDSVQLLALMSVIGCYYVAR